MDHKLARGIARQHIRRRMAESDNEEKRVAQAIGDAPMRLLQGRVVTQPTAVASAWRRVHSSLGGRVVQLGDYRKMAAFRVGWVEQVMDYAVHRFSSSGDELVIPKQDEKFMTLVAVVDAVAVERKDIIRVGTCGPLTMDRHALQRWLERQPGGDTDSFERAALAVLPAAALLASVVGRRDFMQHAVVPFGDGLLLGICGYQHGKPEDEVFGMWRHFRSGKPVERQPALLAGPAITEVDRLGGMVFAAKTYFGPHELDGLEGVRDALLGWQARHSAAIESTWRWLGNCALANTPVGLPPAIAAAMNELQALSTTETWWEVVTDRGERAAARCAGYPQCA